MSASPPKADIPVALSNVRFRSPRRAGVAEATHCDNSMKKMGRVVSHPTYLPRCSTFTSLSSLPSSPPWPASWPFFRSFYLSWRARSWISRCFMNFANAASVQEPLLGGGNIRSVLMREHALTGRHVQELRQILIVRADNFFVDDARQLNRNCD